MGEIYVKKNNAFERVVSDGNTVIITGGGGGSGGGVTIASYAYRSDVDSDATIPYASSTPFPHDGTETGWAYRNLSKHLDRVLTNTNSLGTGQQFSEETGKFTAPVAGVYRFDATAVIQLSQAAAPADAVWFYMWLRKNPANHNTVPNTSDARIGQLVKVYRDEDAAAASTAQIVNATETWQVELSANDTVVLCGGWNSAAGTTLLGASFSASYIGGASVTPANPVAVYAYSTKDSNTPVPTSPTRLSGAFFANQISETVDDSQSFDPSTGAFTAPVNGKYSIGYTLSANNTDGAGIWVWIQKTPAGTQQLQAPNSANRIGLLHADSNGADQGYAPSGRWIVSLQAGDRITWNIFATNGDQYIRGGDGMGFSWDAHLLTSTQTIGVNTDVAFSAHTRPQFTETQANNGGGSNPGIHPFLFAADLGSPPAPSIFKNTIVTNASSNPPNVIYSVVEQVDTTNSYDPATGQFTVPISGVYEFEGTVDFKTQNGGVFIWMEKNNGGVVKAGLYGHYVPSKPDVVNHLVGRNARGSAGGANSHDGSTIVTKNAVTLNAGETVCLCFYGWGDGQIVNWTFSGKLLRRA